MKGKTHKMKSGWMMKDSEMGMGGKMPPKMPKAMPKKGGKHKGR